MVIEPAKLYKTSKSTPLFVCVTSGKTKEKREKVGFLSVWAL